MITGYAALFIFMLAAFTGYEVIGRVPAILHTPLMSGSNFVHGVVVVGAVVALGSAHTTSQRIIGFVAVLLGTANAVGGYAVTERMLDMFTAGGPRKPGSVAEPDTAAHAVVDADTAVRPSSDSAGDRLAVNSPDAAAPSDRQKADSDA
jgi:NAD(P) transhydrogenase subunit alpha